MSLNVYDDMTPMPYTILSPFIWITPILVGLSVLAMHTPHEY